jgi:hypothetical protein
MAKVTFKPKQFSTEFPLLEEGLYNFEVDDFTPKWVAKKGDLDTRTREERGINFNPVCNVVSSVDGKTIPTREDGKPLRVFFNATSTMSQMLEDFSHACGLPLEGDPETGQSLIGSWEPVAEPDIEKCHYVGPLSHRKFQAYVIKSEYEKNGVKVPKNEFKYFVCRVENCAQKFPKLVHLKSMQFKKKDGNGA